MRGLITDINLEECDEEFPGIVRYYRELQDKPRTFLELVWRFVTHGCGGSAAKVDGNSGGVASAVANR